MDSDQRAMSLPPPLEEGYWEALLREGENAEPVHRNSSQNGHTTHHNHHHAYHHAQDHTEASYPTAHTHHHALIERDWQNIQAIMDADQTVELTIMGYNRGGLLVEWRHIRGFVPASQLLDFPANANSTVRREALMARVGGTLTLRVIELNQQQNRLVLSERAAQVQPGERAHILESLSGGEIIEGYVTNICEFGVFVDLGGLEGLIHISELSWGRVRHPGDMLSRDDHVRVYVLDTDPSAGRVALSLKRLHKDPWQTVESRYEIGQIITARVTNVVDFGAFACIEEGLEGLVHVSEMAEGNFLHPRNVVSEEQPIRARILSIDSKARRLGLSLRDVQQPEA